MTVYHKKGDGVEGEILIAFFGKMSGARTIVGSRRHRERRVRLMGTPARCFINKQVRSLERK